MSGELFMKICLLGGSNVGKTCMIRSFIHGDFLEDTKATIEDLHEFYLSASGTRYNLTITDTGGDKEVQEPLRLYQIQNNDYFVLVYDVTVKESITVIHDIYEDYIMKHHSKFVPLVVFGNKTDLLENKGKKKSVTTKDVEEMIEHTRIRFLEGSAKTGTGIQELFETLVSLKEKNDNQVSISSSHSSPSSEIPEKKKKRSSSKNSKESSSSKKKGKKKNTKSSFCFSPNTREDLDEDIANFY